MIRQKKTNKKSFKKRIPWIIMISCLVIGLGLVAYPTFANWWNTFHSTRAVNQYNESVSALSSAQEEELLDQAKSYNQDLLSQDNRYFPTNEFHARYEETLNLLGNGVMGTVSIPAISVSLPIYHGTEDTVLQIAAGHLEGTSLPIGGLGTHAVISGHRGLPSARLFTDLDKLECGDVFILNVLNEKLTYEIDSISIVLPEETSQLDIDPEKDQVTLLTCTPYGINSHRLLLTGHRIENRPDYEITSSADLIDKRLTALIIGALILAAVIVGMAIKSRRKPINKA